MRDGLTTVFDKMAMPHTPWAPERRGIDYDAMNGYVSCELSDDLSDITPERLRASGWPEPLVQAMVEGAKASPELEAYERELFAQRKKGIPGSQPA